MCSLERFLLFSSHGATRWKNKTKQGFQNRLTFNLLFIKVKLYLYSNAARSLNARHILGCRQIHLYLKEILNEIKTSLSSFLIRAWECSDNTRVLETKNRTKKLMNARHSSSISKFLNIPRD